MHPPSIAALALAAATLAACPLSSQQPGTARPRQVLAQVVPGMPTSAEQEVRVLTAVFEPGDRTVFHTHRSPVTVYVLEGTFTLAIEGREPLTVRVGEAMVEPPHARMTGFNRSATERTRVVIFYVSEPGTPFLDPVSTP